MNAKRITPRLFYFFSLLNFIIRKISNKMSVFFYLPALLRGQSKIKITLKNKKTFQIRDLYDLLALKEVFADEDYFPLFRNLKRKTTLVDIGTYIGDVVIYAQQFKNIKQIISLDPSPDNFCLAERNIEINSVKNTTLRQLAVSDRKGSKFFFLHRNRGQNGFYGQENTSKKIKVRTITLTEISGMIKYPYTILKCDCEGAEYDILTKTKSLYLKNFNRIIFEYHDEKKVAEIISRLQTIGFKTITKKHPVEDNLGIVFARRI